MRRTDLTSGPIASSLMFFALPLILGNMLQTLYNAADSIIVGHFVGPDALASVGSAYSLMTFLTSIMIGLAMGAGISFSYLYALKDWAKLRRALAISFAFIAFVTAVLTAASIAFTDRILRLLAVPESLMGMMKDYLRYIFPGLPALFAYNYFAAAERAIGNSKVPLIFMALSAVMNVINIGGNAILIFGLDMGVAGVILDLVFVAVFGWGIAGAAIATLISQAAAGIGITLHTLISTPVLRFSLKDIVPDRALIREIGSLSVLTALQQSVMNPGILMVQGIVNSFGPAVMAAFAAGVKIDSLAYMPLQEFGNAFGTFVSQNRAVDSSRVRQGVKAAFIIATIFGLLVSAVIFIIPDAFMRIFVSGSETEIIAIGRSYLRIEGSFYILIGYLFLFYAIFRGFKEPSISLVLTVISLGLRVLLAWIFSRAVGPAGIWASIPIGWLCADAAGLAFYARKKR